MTWRELQRLAEDDAALLDELTDAFAQELAQVLKLTNAQVRDLLHRLDVEGGRLVRTVENLQRAVLLREDLIGVLQDGGFNDLVARAMDEPLDRIAQRIVARMPEPLATFDLDALVALKEIRYAELFGVGQDVANVLWRSTLDGVVGARPVLDLVGDIADAMDVDERWARQLYDTAVSTYSRQVGQLSATGDPDELFVYVGPEDDKTREFCRDLVGKVHTRAEIDAMDNEQLPNVLLTGGGYNCRHQWQRVTPFDTELIDMREQQTAEPADA